MLSIPLERLTCIIEKARTFDALVPADADEIGSNQSNDSEREILLDTPQNPTLEERREAIAQAHETRSTTEADYLIGTPLLSDYLEEGVAALGLSPTEFETSHF